MYCSVKVLGKFELKRIDVEEEFYKVICHLLSAETMPWSEKASMILDYNCYFSDC